MKQRPFYRADDVPLYRGDCREVLPTITGAHSIVTDPPYGLGFMGCGWDHSVPGVEFWRLALRACVPGAHMLCFGGTRTFHRLAAAIEDAGWEIRDTIMWVYGSGFPKSLNIGDGRGTALKPAWEPIIVARAPLDGTVANNARLHRAGALNIDACRIAGRWHTRPGAGDNGFSGGWRAFTSRGAPGGRWPANLIHDGSAESLAGFPQSDRSGGPRVIRIKNDHNNQRAFGDQAGGRTTFDHGDRGSAARFFYCAKAGRAEREAGCVRLRETRSAEISGGGGINHPNGGVYQARKPDALHNYHPTVKPLALMRYLVRLVTPVGGVVLDPFAGSGSTGVAAVQEGRWFAGIEMDAGYCKIARARLRHAMQRTAALREPVDVFVARPARP